MVEPAVERSGHDSGLRLGALPHLQRQRRRTLLRRRETGTVQAELSPTNRDLRDATVATFIAVADSMSAIPPIIIMDALAHALGRHIVTHARHATYPEDDLLTACGGVEAYVNQYYTATAEPVGRA